MPKRARKLSPMPIFDPIHLPKFLKERGSKRPLLHAAVLWRHLLRTRNASLATLTHVEGFPPSLLPPVQLHFVMFTISLIKKVTSSDKSTTKMLLRLQDGFDIETVVMRHGCTTARRVEGESRTTVCVSSQIGCKMGCKFCATGTMGEMGDLWSGEIVEQVAMASYQCNVDVRNVVFMGMGEPMNNYNNMIAAVTQLIDQRTFSLSPSRITVSTVGIVPRMESFTEELGQKGVSLALSLHAPNQKLRASFVPAARAYPLNRLMQAVDIYTLRTNKKILMEYCLMAGVNDSMESAHELGALLSTRKCLLNLIPYNNTAVDAKYQQPSLDIIAKFADIVMREYGVRTTIRKEMGGDVAAACGQLVTLEEPQIGGLLDTSENSSSKKTTTNQTKEVMQKEVMNGSDALMDMEDMFVSKVSIRKIEREEARKGHKRAINRMKGISNKMDQGDAKKIEENVKMTYDEMMKFVDSNVEDHTYVPKNRPLFPIA